MAMEVARHISWLVSRRTETPHVGDLGRLINTRLDQNSGKHKVVWNENTGEVIEAAGFFPKHKWRRAVPKKVIRTYTIGTDPAAAEIKIIDLFRNKGPKEVIHVGSNGRAKSEIVICEGKAYEERTDAHNLSPREERMLLRQLRISDIRRVYISN